MLEKVFWLLCTLFGAGVAYQLQDANSLKGAVFIALGGVIGLILAPLVYRVYRVVLRRVEWSLQRMSLVEIGLRVSGLIVGFMLAFLLAPLVRRIPWVGRFLPFLIYFLLGYLGWVVPSRKQDEFAGAINFGGRRNYRQGQGSYKLLDTSVIIDGRIADICQTGFVEGVLVIPVFVLEELQKIADSSDTLKRNRGRRGLDILNKIQKELRIPVQIYDQDFPEPEDVDGKLVKLAKQMNAMLLTNDYNLNKIAELHGVGVLNINELANAVKPMVLPGEEMVVHVIKDGKETGQGVAYLDDGTMIVIDGGRRYIGNTIHVLVTSVLQTAAGRMIFAKPKSKVLEKAL